jgi:hypothetical protein
LGTLQARADGLPPGGTIIGIFSDPIYSGFVTHYPNIFTSTYFDNTKTAPRSLSIVNSTDPTLEGTPPLPGETPEVDPRGGTAVVSFWLEVRPLGVSFYHAARGCVCCCGCGPVGNAEALSIMSTALTPAVASRQTAIGERSASAWCGRRSLYNEV